jgi:hypothetical protein
LREDTSRVSFSSISEFAEKIRQQNLGDTYLACHAKRYAILISVLSPYFTSRNLDVLDIGYSKLTGLLNEVFGVKVDSLGLDPDHQIPTGTYYHFDLHDAKYPNTWRKDLPKYAVVICLVTRICQQSLGRSLLHVLCFWRDCRGRA